MTDPTDNPLGRQFRTEWRLCPTPLDRQAFAEAVISMAQEYLESNNEFVQGLHPQPDCQGYHPIGICADAELLCEHCIMDPTNPVLYRPGYENMTGDPDSQWTIVGWTNSGDFEDPEDEQCAHCGRGWT